MRIPRLLSRRTAAFAGIAGLLLATAAPPGASAAPRTGDRWLADALQRSVNGDSAFRHVRAWQRAADTSGGTRATGTPGFAKSARYLTDRLRRAGYTVRSQPVPYEDFAVDAEKAAQTAPARRDLRVYAMRWAKPTPVGGFEAPVVFPDLSDATPGCQPEDYAGRRVAGAIVVVPRLYDACRWAEQQKVVAALGARAMLLYERTPEPTHLWRTTVFDRAGVTIPTGDITQREAEQLAAQPPGTVRLHLDLRGHTASGTTENLFAETRGGRADRTVMTGAHLDSVADGPGINDNATSAAALLEVALRLAPHQDRVRNKVRFAWWGAEELVDVGSYHYVGSLTPQERASIALYLNYELIASPNFARFIIDGDDSDHGGTGGPAGPPGSGAVEAALTGYFSGNRLPYELEDLSAVGSDQQPFVEAGIPVGGMDGGVMGIKTEAEARRYGGRAGQMYDPCYHQPCDRAEGVDRRAFAENVRAIGWVTGRFALDVEDVAALRR
ncbi:MULTISPECIES: M28 family peptidase [Actinomadura]|uniref:M28 family peptidase n=1 Tax=Actinomadura yumaensis TaxID=111807 RepID=A0ABW2CTM8_9ACTN|nr:M28 family peptidase [Actinomadura sp. J1-007]MWK40596.1 M28 family peptidase [Actinomadura sp. J1-007]